MLDAGQTALIPGENKCRDHLVCCREDEVGGEEIAPGLKANAVSICQLGLPFDYEPSELLFERLSCPHGWAQ